MTNDALLPCPFCGGDGFEEDWDAVTIINNLDHQKCELTCKGCGVTFYLRCTDHIDNDIRKHMIKQFNTRAALAKTGDVEEIPKGIDFPKEAWFAMGNQGILHPVRIKSKFPCVKYVRADVAAQGLVGGGKSERQVLCEALERIGWNEIKAFKDELRKGQSIYEDAGGYFKRAISRLFDIAPRNEVVTYRQAAQKLIDELTAAPKKEGE